MTNENNGVVDADMFDTEVDSDGNTVLVVNHPDHGANVLENLQPQEAPVEAPVEATSEGNDEAPVEAPVEATSEGNDEAPVEATEDVHSLEVQHDEDTEVPGVGHNQPADPAEMRRDFFKDINKFGKASGEGASALGRLGLRSLRAAADGIISTAKPAGGGKDDATLIYEAYAAMDSKHSEHTSGGSKANASKLRQVIAMGCMTTLADPVAVGDRTVRIHERMTEAELKPKALFAALVDVSREQQGSDTELTDAMIEGCLTKTKADKTLEKEWAAIAKKVEGLVTGEASHGLKDDSDVALKISQLVDERLKQYSVADTRNERIDAMVELGYTLAQAVAIIDKKLTL